MPFLYFLRLQAAEIPPQQTIQTQNRNLLPQQKMGSADELNEKLDDLYQQENQLFADHKDAWDKAFGLMNKNAAGDAMSENYADSLANTVESNKDSFSEEEYETLCKDIETIRGIEEEIAKLEKEIAASDSSDSSSSKSDESTAVFKGFKGKDLDGNDVDDSLFTNKSYSCKLLVQWMQAMCRRAL